MKVSRSLLTGSLVFGGMVLLVVLTYLVPFMLLRRPDDTGMEPATATPMNTALPVETPGGSADTDDPVGPEIIISPFKKLVTSRGRPELEISADEARMDQKKRLFILKEIRELKFFGQNGEVIRIRARHGLWNQQSNKVEISDTVHADITQPDREPITVDCQWLEYDPDTETLVGGSDVVIRRRHYTARGDKLTIQPALNYIELRNNVEATIALEAFQQELEYLSEPIRITCGIMFYNGENRILECKHDPRMVSGRNTVESETIRLDMENKNTQILLTGPCRLAVYPPPSPGETPVRADIRAGEILLDLNAGEMRLLRDVDYRQGSRRLTATDRVSLVFDPDSKSIFGGNAAGNVQFAGEDITGGGELVSWDPITGMILIKGEARLDNNRDTKVAGNTIQLQTRERFYVVDGNAELELENMPATRGFRPEASETSEEPMFVQSDRIEVNEVDGVMDFIGETQGRQGSQNYAAGELQILFDPRTRQMTRMTAENGITMSDGDRIVTGGKFRYDAATGNAEIWDNPVMWRGDGQVRAQRFVMNDKDRILRMMESVEVVTSVPEDAAAPTVVPDASGNQQIHLTAGNGSWDDQRNIMDFQDNVILRWGIWTIHSDSLRIELDPDTGEMAAADALGAVEINHPSFDATGHSLTYNPENSILILRGTSDKKCQVKQGERGSQGDEIRFMVNENRFVITKGMSMIMPEEMTGSLQ